jgi:transcription elongation factor GreB
VVGLEGPKMRKGFTRKPQADEPATQCKNYITPRGLQRLKDEHRFLLTRERLAVTEVVAWAAARAFFGATCATPMPQERREW